jgi:hypothetical protein
MESRHSKGLKLAYVGVSERQTRAREREIQRARGRIGSDHCAAPLLLTRGMSNVRRCPPCAWPAVHNASSPACAWTPTSPFAPPPPPPLCVETIRRSHSCTLLGSPAGRPAIQLIMHPLSSIHQKMQNPFSPR